MTSKRVQTQWDLPRLLLPVPLFLWRALVDPGFHRRFSNPNKYFGINLLWGYWSFSLSLGAHNIFFFLCPPSLESLFPPVLWKSCDQIPLAFKVRFPGEFPVPLSDPQAGKPGVRFRTFKTVENFFGIIFLQFVGHLPDGNRISFYCDCAPPTILLRLLCLWTWLSFLVGSSVLLEQWLLKSLLWFWCSHRRKQAHIL